MNLTTHFSRPADQPLTSPFPVKDGWFFALRSGDFLSPDSWQKPVFVRRDYLRMPRPFLSFRRGRFGFYVGWKAFGVDNEDLKKFPSVNPAEVYVGSVALQGFTLRFSANVA